MSTGHPSRHGYVCCTWCGTWRRKAEMFADPRAPEVLECADGPWCIAEIGRKARVAAAKAPPVQFRASSHAGSPEVVETSKAGQ